MASASGTSLALGALSNVLGDTFKGLSEGEQQAPDIEAKALAAKQAREQFPLQQRLLGAQAAGTEEATRASQAESPLRLKLLGAQAERLLRPEPIVTKFGLYGLDNQGALKPWLVPKAEVGEGGFTKITDPNGRVYWERSLTPERVAAANAAMSTVNVNDPHKVISTLAQYKDVFGDEPITQYMNYLRTKYSADTRARAMIEAARLRQGAAGAKPQETTKLRPARPVNFTEGMQLNQEFSKALDFAAQKYTGLNGIGAFADPNSGDVYDPEVNALVPKDFLLRKLMFQSGYIVTPFWNGQQWAFTGAMHAPTVEETIRGPVQEPQAPFILNWGEDDGG